MPQGTNKGTIMILRFSVDDEQFEIDVNRIMNTEAMAVQKVTGYGYDEWLGKCDEGDPQAVTAMVWIAMKRKQPDLAFRDVTFPMRETWGNREYVVDEAVDAEAEEVPTEPAEAGQTESN